jgi:hypothetical protein
LGVNAIKPIDGVDTQDRPEDKEHGENPLRNQPSPCSDYQFLRTEMSYIDSEKSCKDMRHQPKEWRYFEVDLAEIIEFFYEFKNNNR